MYVCMYNYIRCSGGLRREYVCMYVYLHQVQRRPEKRGARLHSVETRLKKAAEKLMLARGHTKTADPSKWSFSAYIFTGAESFQSKGTEELVHGPVSQGIAKLKANPSTYHSIKYQTDMTEWPQDQQCYRLLHRKGTKDYTPMNVGPGGWLTVLVAEYHVLPALPTLGSVKDSFTDQMSYRGYALHNTRNTPLSPGRGMGVGDVPDLKIIGDVDPSDISQGKVGDCWLLSAISSLAEFDGAIKKLFRKTPDLSSMPRDGPNSYTITLWDLPSWTEVDIVVDERLACSADGTGLLGCTPSNDGELWVCYLEKAVAIHCGGWDKIDGGFCTHAFSLLTGCKDQYTIMKSPSGKFKCYGKFNPVERRWEQLGNSPHDGFIGLWPMAWPEVGGGGGMYIELSKNELFERMCAWDDHNFIIGAGTKAGSDKQMTAGIVDGHAYSVLECVNDAAGTDIDLIKMRNPWGKGEISDGMWDDDGPGWDRYPQIKLTLKPTKADDGIFWVSKDEFFTYFHTVFVSASDMTAFLED